jgi:haloalkane dehalogenase
MMITRHYLTVKGRRVHYRRAGSGPPLLMIHQSPRSSVEYEPLMKEWGQHFTCIAPDTPGFGQSDPLPISAPEIGDYADAIVEFSDAAGIKSIAGYGFHSGGIILVTALKRQVEKFSGLAIGGYAIWNDEERAKLGEPYIPPYIPLPYGEHLTWLWNRILEQSWYFPWYDPSDTSRMPGAHDDPARVHAIILEMLDSGDAYRLGYGAVLRGERDIPSPDAVTPPVLITAYTGDPLKNHLERLGKMPSGWASYGVDTVLAHQQASLAHLQSLSLESDFRGIEDENQGFLLISTGAFDGLIHWQGPVNADRIMIHGPGREADLVADTDAIKIDLPGHGLSSAWPGIAPDSFEPWQAVIDVVAAHFKIETVEHEALREGEQPDRIFPDLSPDRFGSYLTRAWSIVRAQHLFSPWYLASKDNAIPIDRAALDPSALAKEQRALIRATAAKALHIARLKEGF